MSKIHTLYFEAVVGFRVAMHRLGKFNILSTYGWFGGRKVRLFRPRDPTTHVPKYFPDSREVGRVERAVRVSKRGNMPLVNVFD